MRRVRESFLSWKSNKYYVCLYERAGVDVALLMQHATRICHVVTSFVAPLALPYFSTLSHKLCDFQNKSIEHKICVLIFSTTLFKAFLILRRIYRDIVIIVKMSSCKVPVIIVRF
jgi:hypothetical protein